MFLGNSVAFSIISNGEETIIPSVDASKLKFCLNLCKLDMSDCWNINPQLVIVAIQNCSHLKEISLENCTQFTEQQMTQMLTSLEKLEFINCTGTQDMIFCNGLQIVASLWYLKAFNVEPKYITFEKKDWERLVETFHLIKFGHLIMRMFPHYGRYLKRRRDEYDV